MGALDKIVSTVLTSYKADTKDHRAELKKLRGAEKDQQEALIKGLDKQNAAIDGHIAMWSKVAVGIGAVVVAAKALEAGFETLKRNTQLAGATIGVNLEGLRKATNGLVDDTRLLQFASKAMNGTFKLSQVEMEQSLQGVLGLRKEGIELTRALENVEKALTEGTVEPLKEFGHVIKGVENDTREGLNAALNDLRKTAAGVGGDFSQTGDDMSQAQVRMANATDDLKESLGRLAVKLVPIVDKLAEMVGHVVWLADWTAKNAPDAAGGVEGLARKGLRIAGAGIGIGGLGGVRGVVDFGRTELGLAENDNSAGRATSGNEAFGQRLADAAATRASVADYLARKADADATANKRRRGKGKGGGGNARAAAEAAAWEKALQAIANLAVEDRIAGAQTEAQAGFMDMGGFDSTMQGIGNGTDASLSRVQENLKALQDMKRDKTRGALADIFGVPAEIDAQAMAIQNLAQTFDGFAGAFGSGVDAMITGSESFASAFKRGIAETLRSLAVEMSIQALKHGAFALGSLAFQDYKGAANHGAAAGMFAAGAVAAGTGAKLLGAGASTGASGGGAGRGAGAGPAGVGASSRNDNKPAESTRIIVLDNGFKDLSARERRSRVRQISRDAGIDVQGDVVVNG